MNIILIGMMGAGKSSVGKVLSKKLQLRFIDTDAMIEEMQGITISKIFELYGEKYFRDLEMNLIQKLSSLDDTVISTGGGIVMNPVNTILLKELGQVIYLKGTLDQLKKNLDGEMSNRPMLNDNSLDVLLRVREPLYVNTAHFVVDIDGVTVEEIADDIMIKINSRSHRD